MHASGNEARSLPRQITQPRLDPGRWLYVAGVSLVLLIEVGPVGVLVGRQLVLCCVIDDQGLEALAAIMPPPAMSFQANFSMSISKPVAYAARGL